MESKLFFFSWMKWFKGLKFEKDPIFYRTCRKRQWTFSGFLYDSQQKFWLYPQQRTAKAWSKDLLQCSQKILGVFFSQWLSLFHCTGVWYCISYLMQNPRNFAGFRVQVEWSGASFWWVLTPAAKNSSSKLSTTRGVSYSLVSHARDEDRLCLGGRGPRVVGKR